MIRVGVIALSLFLTASASAQFAVPAAPIAKAIPNFTLNGGLPKWQACRAKVKAGTGNCKVLVIGESTPAGNGSSYQSTVYNFARATAWPAQIAAILNNLYQIPATAYGVTGDAGATTNFAAYDTRVTLNAWAAQTFAQTAGGNLLGNTTNTTNFAFNPTNGAAFPSNPSVQTDTLLFWPANYAGGDVFSVSVNGGSAIGTYTDSASVWTNKVFSTTLGVNTWDISCTAQGSFGCYFAGFVAYNSTIAQVLVINAGWSGSIVENWNSGAAAYSPLAAIEGIAPDLCIIQDMGNNVGQFTNLTTYTTDTENIIAACQQSGDALIVTSQPAASVGLTMTASVATSVLTVTAASGTIYDEATSGSGQGSTIVGAGIPAGTVVASRGTGTGGTGTYNLSTTPGTIVSESMAFGATYGQFNNYVSAAYTAAAAKNVPIFDWFKTMCGTISSNGTVCSLGGWTANMGAGWNAECCTNAADEAHQGPNAYATEATFITQIMMQ